MVSNIGDGWKDSFPQKWPHFVPMVPQDANPFPSKIIISEVSKADFGALRKEVEELKKLLQAAKAFDDATGQPHCNIDEDVPF